MKQAKILRIYLNEKTLKRARDGKIGFINQVLGAVQSQGFRAELRLDTDEQRLKSAHRNGYSLFRMEDPFHNRAMTFRQVYLPQFWQIETTAKRWEWLVAKSEFKPQDVPKGDAAWFANYWRNILFKDTPDIKNDGFVFIPLQGRLLQQRSFQSASPIQMIKSTLQYSDDHQIIASLHPHETYLPDEIAALDLLAKQNNRFSWVKSGSDGLLAACDYVVTQNSGLAFKGFFLKKPVLLFGRIDFHHIAAKTWEHGVEGSFDLVTRMQPDYERYLFWFLREMSIHSGRDDAQQRIIAAFRRGGWEI